MFYTPNDLNIIQQRIGNIDDQMNNLKRQKEYLMQSYQQPPIQQTFIQQGPQNGQAPSQNFDFNGKWVNGYEEATKVSNDNLPLLIFDKDSDMFYMKQINGQMQAFKYEPVKIEEPKSEVESLKGEISDMKQQLAQALSVINAYQQKEMEQSQPHVLDKPTKEAKAEKKEGK